jgi:hypothetical protein
MHQPGLCLFLRSATLAMSDVVKLCELNRRQIQVSACFAPSPGLHWYVA